MQVMRMFTGDDGRTSFEDIELRIEPDTEVSRSAVIDVRKAVAATAPATLDQDFHNAPRRQLVVVLEGEVEVENGLGERRTIPQGGIMLAEDLDGEGHKTRAVGGPIRMLTIGLAPEVDLTAL